MRLRAFFSKRPSLLLWLATLSLVGVLFTRGSELSFVSGFQQNWDAFKAKLQRKLSPKTFVFSNRIQLLQMGYANRVDFWFDADSRQKLTSALLNYAGPILTNIDPLRISNDPELSKLLKQKNFIRNLRVELAAVIGDEKVALLASDRVEQDPSAEVSPEDCLKRGSLESCMMPRMSILPSSEEYFRPPFFWGFNEIWNSTNFRVAGASAKPIESMLVKMKAGRREIPGSLLAAMTLASGCENYIFTRSNELKLSECLGIAPPSRHISNPLPLRFYDRQQIKRVSLDDLKTSDAVLVVEPIDSAAFFPNFLGEQYSWGELTATALSNIFEFHTPLESEGIKWAEKLLGILAVLFLFWTYRRQEPKVFLETLLMVLGVMVILDLAALLLLNLRTQAPNEFLGVAIFGVVGLGVLSKREFERRSLIERALGGYVSQERLERLVGGQEKLELFGQRKELTTLLLDIEGFGRIAKELSISDVFKFVQNFFALVDPFIFENKGVIDKKTGDGLLAFFGDLEESRPKEAALQAVSAAFQIQDTVRGLDPSVFGLTHEIRLRIGINTGVMMVGNAGSSRHFNYTVLGDAVNFTERLESACGPGEVLVGEATAEYIRDSWKIEKVEIHVKHEDRPVVAYRVLGPATKQP